MIVTTIIEQAEVHYRSTLHVGLELNWQYPLSKFRSEQVRALWCKSISYSIIGLYGTLYDYVIHVALIGIPHITNY